MTKQEFIKLKWEEAGFIWEEIKFIVNPDGGLQLQHPSLKTSLTGYAEAHDKGLLKGYDFDGYGLKVWNKLLDGVEHNNGWTKIESEADLPETSPQKYKVHYNGAMGYIKKEPINFDTEYTSVAVGMMYQQRTITHYKPVKIEPLPLY